MPTRSYDYQPPFTDFASLASLSGLDIMRRVISREVPAPPIAATLGFDLVEVTDGRAIFEGTTADWQYNPLGTVHGGWVATLLDSALGCAAQTTLAAGVMYTTLDLQVRFVKPVLATTGRVRAIGTVLHRGRTIITAEAQLVGADGAVHATATAGCLVIPLR